MQYEQHPKYEATTVRLEVPTVLLRWENLSGQALKVFIILWMQAGRRAKTLPALNLSQLAIDLNLSPAAFERALADLDPAELEAVPRVLRLVAQTMEEL